jgi:hypothetical protein
VINIKSTYLWLPATSLSSTLDPRLFVSSVANEDLGEAETLFAFVLFAELPGNITVSFELGKRDATMLHT